LRHVPKVRTAYLMPTPPPNYYFQNIAVIILNFGPFSQTNNMSNPYRKLNLNLKNSELKSGITRVSGGSSSLVLAKGRLTIPIIVLFWFSLI
jgi:hypothetical protein